MNLEDLILIAKSDYKDEGKEVEEMYKNNSGLPLSKKLQLADSRIQHNFEKITSGLSRIKPKRKEVELGQY